MARLTWHDPGTRLYETGVDRGVLYIPDETGVYADGVAWNGLTSVTETPSGAEPTALWADNIKYLNLFSVEEFGATIEAFTYPDEFAPFDGLAVPQPGVSVGQQSRGTFGLSFRTLVGNDLVGESHGYKLHLVYNCMASPSEKAYNTINDSPEAITFSWEISTVPASVSGLRPTSLIVVDSTVVSPANLKALEDLLYGETDKPTLPTPDEVLALFSVAGPATGATAGTPGVWTPPGSTAPATVAALQASSIVANPTTLWGIGEYVQTQTVGVPGQAHWDGSAWAAGAAN